MAFNDTYSDDYYEQGDWLDDSDDRYDPVGDEDYDPDIDSADPYFYYDVDDGRYDEVDFY